MEIEARHWTLSWATCIQSTTCYLISLRWILILSSPLCLCPPSGFSFQVFHPKYCMHFSSLLWTLHVTHLILLDLITLIIFCEAYNLWSSSLCSLLQPAVTFSLLGPNSLLNTLLSNTHSLFSILSVRDRVAHPYKTTGKIMVLYYLILKFIEEMGR